MRKEAAWGHTVEKRQSARVKTAHVGEGSAPSLPGGRTGFTPVLREPGVSFSSPEGSVTSNGNDGVPDSPSDPADREGKDGASFHVRRRWKGGRCQPRRQGPLWPELLFCISQMENGLSAFEEQAEKNLEILCKEKEKLQKKAYELKRRLLLCQKKKELEDFLDAQVRGDHGLQVSCPSSISPLGRVGESLYCECPSSFGFNSISVWQFIRGRDGNVRTDLQMGLSL